MSKRALDVLLALAGLAVLAPVGVVAALAIVLTSRGGPLHGARRVGRGRVVFTMWKLRTMRTLRSMQGVARSPLTARDDPRVTPVGRVLRRTRLDEWPQLWNVLVGQMSLVGPRPEDPRLVDPADPQWQRVLSVRPGITGPTQIEWAPREANLLRTADAESVYRTRILPAKLASDLDYVRRRSLAGDVRLLVRSLLVPFRSPA